MTGNGGAMGMKRGNVGRPSLSWHWAPRVREILKADSGVRTAEILRRLRLQGYPGGKSSFYQLVALCRMGPPSSTESGNC
jgi:hypothetical protein